MFNLIVMRMKKIVFAFAAALAIFSACQKTTDVPAVQFDQANYILPAEEGVTVKVVSDKALTAEVEFTVSGTAVKDEDYKISVDGKVSFADSYEAAIVIEPLNSLEDKNIILELKGASDGSFKLGGNARTTVVITPKEKLYYSFANPQVHFSGTYELELTLVGATSGEKFRAEGELKVPFIIDGTAEEGTDFEVEGGEHYLVAADGSNVAKVKFISKHETVPEVVPTLFVKIPEDAARFIAGVNPVVELGFSDAPFFGDLVGKYTYSSYPIKDDEDADLSLFEMLAFSETGDTWDNIPCNHFDATSTVEFKVVDGVNKLLVSGPGDIFDYLVETEVTDVRPYKYTWYYYQPYRPLTNAVELTLSKVNYAFNNKTTDYREGSLILNLGEDGKLDVIIPDYSFKPAAGLYYNGLISYEEGLLWDVQAGNTYFDCYYIFQKVAE